MVYFRHRVWICHFWHEMSPTSHHKVGPKVVYCCCVMDSPRATVNSTNVESNEESPLISTNKSLKNSLRESFNKIRWDKMHKMVYNIVMVEHQEEPHSQMPREEKTSILRAEQRHPRVWNTWVLPDGAQRESRRRISRPVLTFFLYFHWQQYLHIPDPLGWHKQVIWANL